MPSHTKEPAPRRRRKKEKLTPQQIAEAALRLVEERGLDGLTMRALANAMDVQAPVLYRQIADKEELLNEMAEAIARKAPLDDLSGDDPYADLAESTRRLRRVLLSHRDGARIMGGSCAAKHNTLSCAEILMGLLVRMGLPKDKAMWTMMSLLSFTLGEVLDQQGLPDDPTEAKQAILSAAGDVLGDPHFQHLDTDLIEAHLFEFDQRFEFGLKLFLAGIKAEVESREA